MRELQDKIKQHIVIDTASECWLWQMYCNRKGYGLIKWKGATRLAHRLAYTAYNGEIPKGLIVRHTCDTPQCCNPKHLLVGTVQDNANDMYSRGREPCRKGANNPKAKLTWNDVRTIRASTEPVRVLADTYGVSRYQIRSILKNQSWVE